MTFERQARPRSRGFTLIETMIVVAIIAVLATLAVYGVRKYLLAARTAEPIEMINSIRAAQEAYKDETFNYLDVSTDLDTFYPAAPDKKLRNFAGPGDGAANWQQLGISANSPVQFGYACVASNAGDALPTLGVTADLNYPEGQTHWYIVKAAGDRDADGTKALFVGSSFTDQIYSQDEDE